MKKQGVKDMKTLLCIVGILVVVLVILYLLAIMPRMWNRPDFTPFTGWLYAHRGLHDNETGAPENSLAAFQKAVDAGYGIELDIQLTKDDVIVVFHDFNLKRVCGVDKKIRDLTYEELQQYRICGSDQQIPTFRQVLDLVDGQVPLIIEYKVPGMDTKVCELGDAMLQNYTGLYCIESFHPSAVLWYRTHRPEVVRGFLSDSFVKEGYSDFPVALYEILHNLCLNFLIQPDFIAYNCRYYNDLSRRLCRDLYHAPAVAWTIKSQQELEERADDFDIFIFDSFIPQE
jgi:glycerophosphoryl diester phosphodiesterase